MKLDQLTFTRFVAAMMVVFSHGGDVFPGNTFPFNPLITSGPTAVGYFFVLSGFVMAIVYYRPGQPFEFGKFWKARFSRIYPVYVLAFVLTCLFYIDIMARVKTGKIMANLLLIQAWFPRYAQSFNIAAWSLSVEAFFYLLFPLLAIWAARISVRGLIWASFGFWILSQAINMGLLHDWFGPIDSAVLLYSPLVHLNSFVLGLAGGVWFLSEGSTVTGKGKLPRWGLLLGMALVASALLARRLIPAFHAAVTLDAGLLAPFFLLIILSLAVDKSALVKRLSHPWLILLGDASYAVYILHLPVRWIGERWAAQIEMPYSIFLYGYWVFLVATSIFIFLRIERPARDWLRKNFSVMLLVLLDLLIIVAGVYLAFALRVGTGDALESYADALRFMIRLALAAYLGALIGLRLYDPRVMNLRPRRLIPPILAATLLGALLVTAGMFVAAGAEWIEGVSKSILLLSAALIAAMAFAVRTALSSRSPKRIP